MKLELLRQMDTILSKCGHPTMPGGVSCVPLTKDIVVPMILESGQTTVFMREIPGDTIWQLRAIASDQGIVAGVGGAFGFRNIRMQIQFPNGRYLFGGNGIDVSQFCTVGSGRFPMTPSSMDFEPGGKLKVTLTDTTPGGFGGPQSVNLVFEGAYLYFLEGGDRALPWRAKELASSLAKYQGIVNENILAPCWRTGAEPPIPAGYTDHEHFTYASQVITFTLGTNENGQLIIPIDNGYDFFCRRLLVDLQLAGAQAPPVAIVLGRLRTGTGYSFNDDFIDLARYLCGAEWPKDWKIRGRDEVIIDLQVTDIVGAGTVTYQVLLEGVRRRKA